MLRHEIITDVPERGETHVFTAGDRPGSRASSANVKKRRGLSAAAKEFLVKKLPIQIVRQKITEATGASDGVQTDVRKALVRGPEWFELGEVTILERGGTPERS